MEFEKTEYGNYLISNKAIKDIAQIACNNIKDVYPSKKENDFVEVTFDKNDQMTILLQVRIKQGIDVAKLCKKIQEELNENILLMTGIDCKNINIDIQGFVSK